MGRGKKSLLLCDSGSSCDYREEREKEGRKKKKKGRKSTTTKIFF